MRSGQLYSVLSAISWLASLSVISLCIWIVLSGIRRHMKETVTTKGLYNIPKVRPRGEVTIWIATMMTMLAIGLALGYGARDRQLVSNSHTYWDVAILEKYSDISFRIQPARMQDGQWDFCAPVPFQKSDELRYITFEQKNGCKRLEYFQKLDSRLGEKLNVTAQTR